MTLFRGLAMVAAAALLTASPAAGQRTIFNPALSLWLFYSNDVGFSGNDVSDTYYRLQAELPLRREFESGHLELSFAPFVERYDQTAELDNEGHRARATLSLQPDELSALELTARSLRTQDRDAGRDFADPEAFLTARTRRDLEAARFQYRKRTSGVFSWDMTALYSQWNFEAVGGSGDTVPEGRRDLGAELGVYRLFSARTTGGLRLSRRRYELDRSGQETVDLLAFYLDRQLNRRWQFELLAGGFHRSGQAADDVDLRSSGPQGSLALIRTSRRAELTARAESALTSGGELPGTAEVRVFELLLADIGLRRSSWHLEARYVHRIPSIRGQPSVDLTSLGGAAEWELSRLVGLRASGFYADQSGEPMLDDSYYRFGASVVVYPLGRSRLGGSDQEALGDE